MKAFVFIFALICFSGASFAQIKSAKNVEFSESAYVVTDSAVLVRFRQGEKLPYKIYDFSTLGVYVYFGGEDKKHLAVHQFKNLADGEVEYLRKIGCDKAPLNSGFRRFCK